MTANGGNGDLRPHVPEPRGAGRGDRIGVGRVESVDLVSVRGEGEEDPVGGDAQDGIRPETQRGLRLGIEGGELGQRHDPNLAGAAGSDDNVVTREHELRIPRRERHAIEHLRRRRIDDVDLAVRVVEQQHGRSALDDIDVDSLTRHDGVELEHLCVCTTDHLLCTIRNPDRTVVQVEPLGRVAGRNNGHRRDQRRDDRTTGRRDNQ